MTANLTVAPQNIVHAQNQSRNELLRRSHQARFLAPQEILTFTKFLLLTAVILPTVPNTAFTQFGINPFKTWLLVVGVCGISYGSYVLLALTRQRHGVLLSGVLGGIYSSTATTVALAKKASREGAAHLFAGGILVASAMMYLRVTFLLMLFSRTLLHMLAVPLLVLGCVAGVTGWCWSHLQQQKPAEAGGGVPAEKSPGIAVRDFLCCRFSCSSGCLSPRNYPFRQHWDIWSCGPYRAYRCGRFYPGDDPVFRSSHARFFGGQRHLDCHRQQQCGQGLLCLYVR